MNGEKNKKKGRGGYWSSKDANKFADGILRE